MRRLFYSGDHTVATSIGLLILRVVAGGAMLIAHGWPKFVTFGEKAAKFPDPLGIGNQASLAATVGAEVVAAACVILGFATRPAAVGLTFTMVIAAFVVHGGQPFAKQELAMIYGSAFLLFALTGAGDFSIDRAVGG